MAFDYKQAIIAGRLTRRPELKQTANGTSICAFTVATNDKDKNGESISEFCECVAFGKIAETMAQYLDKGKGVFVCCNGWRTRKWTDKNGQAHYKTEFIVSDFRFTDPKGTENPKEEDIKPSFDEITDGDLPF